MEWKYARAKSLNLVFSLLEPRLELLCGHLEVLDMSSCAVEEGNLARLLVGDREGILEPAVAIAKLVATSLLGLDALTTDRLAANIGSVSSCDRGLEVVVVLIGIIVARLASWRLGRRASCGSSDGVEAMGAGDGSVRDTVNRRRRMRATAAAAPARSETIGRELATAEVVDGRGGDAVLGWGVGTTRGSGGVVGRGGVRVLADGVGQVESVEVKTGRRRRRTWHCER